MPTGPPAARFPLPVRRRATWGSPGQLMCEWSECHAGPHLGRDAKINCCRRRGLVRPAVASYLIVRVCACPAYELGCEYVCRYRYRHSSTRRSTGPWYRWVPQPRERHGRSKWRYGTEPRALGPEGQGDPLPTCMLIIKEDERWPQEDVPRGCPGRGVKPPRRCAAQRTNGDTAASFSAWARSQLEARTARQQLPTGVQLDTSPPQPCRDIRQLPCCDVM